MVTKSGGPFAGKVVVDLAMSLDGFIEGASHLGSERIELDAMQMIETPFVTHLTYRVRKG